MFPAKLEASVKQWQEWRPSAELRVPPTTQYNCMGLVFSTRRTWIGTEDWPKIQADDGYRPLRPGETKMIGDLVVYLFRGAPAHVGILVERLIVHETEVSWRVLSKWGDEGEYIHPLDHLPTWCGDSPTYWTDRP